MIGIVEAPKTIELILEDWSDELSHALAKGVSGHGYHTLEKTIESLCQELARKEWEKDEHLTP